MELSTLTYLAEMLEFLAVHNSWYWLAFNFIFLLYSAQFDLWRPQGSVESPRKPQYREKLAHIGNNSYQTNVWILEIKNILVLQFSFNKYVRVVYFVI